MSLQSGHVLAGRYRLVSPLGRGGMGTVWRAVHEALGSEVAVKLIDLDADDRDEMLLRFEREARAAAALKSPHIVQIHDYGTDGGTPYLAMELLHGESLGARLVRERVLDPDTTVRILAQVARGVAKAHEAGLMHRDLKPDNIFLVASDEGEEQVKILDFGLAKRQGGPAEERKVTRSGALLGTPYYMSPEQAVGSAVDFRTDLWALGVIAYECLVGRPPFEGEALGGIIMKICSHPLPIPSEHASLPCEFDAWFARACAREPARRFESARVLAGELASSLASVSLVSAATARAYLPSLPAPPQVRTSRTSAVAVVSAPLRGPEIARRRSSLVLAFGLVAALLIAAAATVYVTSIRAPRTSATPPSRAAESSVAEPTTSSPEPSPAAVAASAESAAASASAQPDRRPPAQRHSGAASAAVAPVSSSVATASATAMPAAPPSASERDYGF